MKRAVIYARYSTDLQNDQSVEDQIRLCKAHAERLGAVIVGEYFDRAKSGASMFGRPGLSNLMQAAETSGFDIVIAEATDRLSRDIGDLAHIHKNLTFRAVEINCVNGGRIETLQVGMYGVIGQMQREEGAKKVRRGMVGVVRSGRSAGGKAFGYEPVPGQPGGLRIVDEEADTVRRIFRLYASGTAPRTIAATLNSENAPAPRGSKWNASTINGNGQRGNGILRNPLYNGEFIWNRVRMVKDPSTGRRISRINDDTEFERRDAPELRIVDADLFAAVQHRKEVTGGAHKAKMPRSKRLLSGLLRCGCCDGGMALVGPDRSGNRIQCSTFRESGSCENKRRYYIERIETQVVDSLRLQFADTSIIEAYVDEYKAERRRIANDGRRNRSAMEKKFADARDGVAKIVEKISKGLIEDEEAAFLLAPLRAERDRLKRELEAQDKPSNIIELHPRAVTRFRENIESLSQIVALKDGEPDADIVSAFRELVAAVIVHQTSKGEPYALQIKGHLTSLLKSGIVGDNGGSGRGTRTPDTRIMIPLL